MANLYDVDFKQQSNDLLPPDKRHPKNISIIRALMAPLQWARDLILGSYKTGSNAPIWSAGSYNKWDQVIFNKRVYSSLIDNNTSDPTNSDSWELVLYDFIGVDERIKFNSQKCVLEYALNKRFGGTFRMPPSSHSDIYIQNLPAVKFGFLVGKTIGSTVGKTQSSDNIGWPYTFKQTTGFQINFPIALYNATTESEIRNYTDQYNDAGIRYIIVQY